MAGLHGLRVAILLQGRDLRRPPALTRLVVCRNPALAEERARNEGAIAAETALYGFSVLHTLVEVEALYASATVLAYKSLAHVERAFRFYAQTPLFAGSRRARTGTPAKQMRCDI
jgi:hypothetical protein